MEKLSFLLTIFIVQVETLNAAARVLKEQGEVGDIYVS
jgi:hypothetical protein